MADSIFIFNTLRQIKSQRTKQGLTYGFTHVNRHNIKQNKIVGNAFTTQLPYDDYQLKIGACALYLLLKNFVQKYISEKLIKNIKEFKHYSTKTEKAKLNKSLKNQNISPVLKQQGLNKKINTLSVFLGESTSTNHKNDSYYLLKDAACYARVLKTDYFFYKQTFVFTTITSYFIFLKKTNRFKLFYVLQDLNKTKAVALKQKYRTYDFLQTLLEKYLETTPKTKNNLVYVPVQGKYKTFIQKQGLCHIVAKSQHPFAFFFSSDDLTLPKEKLQNQLVTTTKQRFRLTPNNTLFNKIDNKSLLSYWLISIAGFAFLTPNIYNNTTVQTFSTKSFYDGVFSLHKDTVEKGYTVSQTILSLKTRLCGAEVLNKTGLILFKPANLTPLCYQNSQSLIIKKTFNNLYNFIKTKTTLSKTTKVIPITQNNGRFEKKKIINFSYGFVTTNTEMLEIKPIFTQKKAIKNTNTHHQLSNTLMSSDILQSLNNNVKTKWFYDNSILKKNIYAFVKPFFFFECNNCVTPFYFNKLKLFFALSNIVRHLKKPVLFLSTINPLYSNRKFGRNISFIKDIKTLKLFKNKIMLLNKTQKKNKKRLQLTSLEKKLSSKTENIGVPLGENTFGFNRLKQPEITYSHKKKKVISYNPLDSYKEGLFLINRRSFFLLKIKSCRHITYQYNEPFNITKILNMNNISNKNKILLNYFFFKYGFLFTSRVYYRKPPLKSILIKTIIDVSYNKIKNNLIAYNHPLTKSISLNAFPYLKTKSTRVENKQNQITGILLKNGLTSLYNQYITEHAFKNKIIVNKSTLGTKKVNNTSAVNLRPELHLSYNVRTPFLALSSKQTINSLSVLFKHHQMFKNQTEIEKQRLHIQKKRKAIKQRLRMGRPLKRTRLFPRPNWLRYRMFLNTINQRKLSLMNLTIKKNKESAFAEILLKRKNKAFKTLFLHKIKFKLSFLTCMKLHTIFKQFFISKNQIKSKKSVVSANVLKKTRLAICCLNKVKNYYLDWRVPLKYNKKKLNSKQISLQNIKIGNSSVKANYQKMKKQKTKNSSRKTKKDKDKDTLFRAFWICAYNNTITNNKSQKLWWLLPNNTSLFINSFFWDFGEKQKTAIFKNNKASINNIKQIKNIFAIARISWALNKTNYNSFTRYNKRYHLWVDQKRRNQCKKNKTKLLKKQIIDLFNIKIFFKKNLSVLNNKISSQICQYLQKIYYLTSYSYPGTNVRLSAYLSVYGHDLETKNIRFFNDFFWSNLKIKTSVKNTYLLDKQQDSFFRATVQLNDLKKTLNSTLKNKIADCNNVYCQSNLILIGPLIISCLVLFHLCALISLVSISQVRCLVNFHLILVYKLTNVYTNLLGNVSAICKPRHSNVVIKQQRTKFFTNTSTPNVKINLMLFVPFPPTGDRKHNQKSLLTYFSFNLLKKEFKNKHNVILKLSNMLKLKSQYVATSNNLSIIKPFVLNHLNIIYSKVHLISLKTKSLKRRYLTTSPRSSQIEHKTVMFRKRVLMPYKLYQSTFYFKKTTIHKTKRTFKFLKTTISGSIFYLIDLLKSSVRFVSSFFEKPAEYTTTWIAFGFLVEWSSDPITIIPEKVDFYSWKMFSNFSREKNIQYALNSYYALLTIFGGFRTKSQLYLCTNTYRKLNAYIKLNRYSFPVLLTILHLLQNRIKLLFDLFIETTSQPDTDLIARQEKGTLFWDIWADFLVTAANYYNVNDVALSTSKAEQNALIETISNDNGIFVSSKQIKNKNNVTLLPHNKKSPNLERSNTTLSYDPLQNRLILFKKSHDIFNIQKKSFIKSYFMDRLKDFTKKEEKASLINRIHTLALPLITILSPFILFDKPKKRATDLLDIVSSQLVSSTVQESKLDSILAILKQRSINQYITYQSWHSHNGSYNANGDLFIDYHPPKSLSHIPAIQYNSTLQEPIGNMVCQIYSGIFKQQISKNLLLVNTKTTLKHVLGASSATDYNAFFIQALAGETELKIVTDNAQRYAIVIRGFALGIKLLRDVFDAIALNTPCIFLLEDIHTIGERRPKLMSDSGETLADDLLNIQLDFFGGERDEIHDKNQVVYQLTRHGITHYKKPFRGDYSLAIPTNLYLTDLFFKLSTRSTSNLSLVEKHKLTIKNKIKNQSFLKCFFSLKTSCINIIRQTKKKKVAPPSTSPYSVLLLKEEKKLKPNKIVEELPWTGIPGELLSTKPRASYSVRAKVALLADLSLSNMAAKLDMITDLLVIIDRVRSNKGFVVFATTDIPHVLDPALRRPGRLDETIRLPNNSNNTRSKYEIIKQYNLNLKNYNLFFTTVVQQGSMGLPIMLLSKNTLFLNIIKKKCNTKEGSFVIKQRSRLCPVSKPQHVCMLHIPLTAQAINKKNKDKAYAYYEVGKELLKNSLKMCVRTDIFNLKDIPLPNKIFGIPDNILFKNINKLSLYTSKNNILLQLMLVFGGKMSHLLGTKYTVNTIKIESKKALSQTACLLKIEPSKLFEAALSAATLFGIKADCLSLQLTPNEKLSNTTSILLSFIHKRYLYKKNLILPKLLSFIDGNVLEEPPCPPFSSLLIPAKRFENYKRVFHDSIVSNKMGQRKAQISFIEKLQNQIQLRQNKELKNTYGNVQQTIKTTQDTTQHKQFKQSGNLTTVPAVFLVQTMTNINWYYQNRILKRHGHYLTNQWWNSQLSEHNAETVFLSDIDWRSSFIKNKQITTNFQLKNSAVGLDFLLDFPDTYQYYNPRRRRWLLNNGYWSFWFNFDNFYSKEIISTWILESILQTYMFLHNNTELLDFVTSNFIVLGYYLGKYKITLEKTTYPKTFLTSQRSSLQALIYNKVKAITKTELKTFKEKIITNSFQRF